MKIRARLLLLFSLLCLGGSPWAAEPVQPWMLADWQNPAPHLADAGLTADEVAAAIGRRLVILPQAPRDIVIPGSQGPRRFKAARFLSAVAVVDLPAATLRQRLQDFSSYRNLFPLLPESEVVQLDGRNLVARYRLDIPLPAMATFTVDFRVKHTLERDGSISALLIDGQAKSLVAMLGGMTDNLADQPVAARWEALPLNAQQSLLVFTYWDRLELKSFFARKFIQAYPELKVAGPYLAAMTATEAVRRNFVASVPRQEEPLPAPGLQAYARLQPLLQRFSAYGHVAVMEPDFTTVPEQKVPPLRYVSLATRIAAPVAETRAWATRYTRLPDALKELRKVRVADHGPEVDLGLNIHFGVLLIRFSMDLDVHNHWASPERLEFQRTAGDLAQVRGASEWHALPGSGDTLVLVSAAHEVGDDAPFVIRMAHKIVDRLPWIDQLGSLLVQVVVMERLKPWIEHNATHPAAAAASLPEAVGAH